MKTTKSFRRSGLRAFGGVLLSMLLLAPPVMSAEAEDAANTTFDNLVPAILQGDI